MYAEDLQDIKDSVQMVDNADEMDLTARQPRSVSEHVSKKDRERLHSTARNAKAPSSALPSLGAEESPMWVPILKPYISQTALRGFQPFTSNLLKHV